MNIKRVKIEEIAEVKGGKRLPKGHSFVQNQAEHLYIRARDIGNNKISIKEPVYIDDHTHDKLRRYKVNSGDVVVTIVGANIGDTAYINDDFDGANLTENAAKIIVDRSKCNSRFLSYQLSSSYAKKQFQFIAAGSAQGKLGLYKIKSFIIHLPKLDSQIMIANQLEIYDDLIENNNRRIKLLEQAARLIYKEWFVHFRFPGSEKTTIIDGIPKGWERTKIGKISSTYGGGTPSTKVPDNWNGDIIWIVPTDVTKNSSIVLLDSDRKITDYGLKNSSAKLLPPNTILMTSRASVGYFALIDAEVCTNQGFINIIPNSNEYRMYILFNLMNRVNEVRGNAKGSTYPEISKGIFREMDIVFPNKKLATIFEKEISVIVDQIRCLKRTNCKLQEAQQLLLPRLMNGEISL